MIYRLKLGNPFETDAVVNFEEVNDRSDVEFLELLGNLEVQLFIDNHPSEGEAAVTVTYEMSDEAVIYGLGAVNIPVQKIGYDTELCAMPFFHAFGLCAGGLNALNKGARSIFLPKFDADQFVALIKKYHVTEFNGVPNM